MGIGFYGWSYPYYYDYYPYPYYDYYPYSYYAPSYYEAPVYPSANSIYNTNVVSASYVTPQRDNRSAPRETRYPDVAIPRMELPAREAPEVLPDEETVQPPRNSAPRESKQPEGSKQ